MVDAIYGLCALTAFLCCWLLLRAYRLNRYRLLLWGGLCFMGLTVNNILLVIDKAIIPEGDLSLWRTLSAFVSMLILLYGLIVDNE